MVSVEDVKRIDVITKDTVNGYLRRIQLCLPSTDIYYCCIPALVSYWCILYFYINECFDPIESHNHYIFEENNTIIRKTKSSEVCAFLSNIVREGIHRWKFEIFIKEEWDTTKTIGIWKNNHPLDNKLALFSSQFTGKFYGWCLDDASLVYGDSDGYRDYADDEYVTDGDIIEMILDLNKKQLGFKRNDKDYGVAFENIEDTSYRAAVSFFRNVNSIKLIEYSASYQQDGN